MQKWARVAKRIGEGKAARYEPPLPPIAWQWMAWSKEVAIYRSVSSVQSWWAKQRRAAYKYLADEFGEEDVEKMDAILKRVRNAIDADALDDDEDDT